MRTGRPPIAPELRREAILKVMTTAAEREELERAAKQAGLAVSVWVRVVSLERARQGRPPAVQAVRDFVDAVYESDKVREIDLTAQEIRGCLDDCSVHFTLPQIAEALEIVRAEWRQRP